MNSHQPELSTETQALQRHEAQSVGLSIEQVFQAVCEKDISHEKVAVMKELLAMNAEQRFNAAFIALQNDLPVIIATTVIKNRGKYAKFEDVMRQVSPHLSKHGFSVSFSMDINEKRIIETCHLSHVGGHTRSNSFAVRPGPADSETQSDCKAATTAKRNALCNALNIVIRQDVFTEENDPTAEGEKITPKQADEIRKRIKNVGRNEGAFLEWAGAKTFEEIMTGRLPEIDEFLSKAERIAVQNLGKK